MTDKPPNYSPRHYSPGPGKLPVWIASDGQHSCYVEARDAEDAHKLAALQARFRDLKAITVRPAPR